MKSRLPYWVSPLRQGHSTEGRYVALDIAKAHKSPKTTLRFFEREFDGMDAQQRSKLVALQVHEKAKELGFIPKDWRLA